NLLDHCLCDSIGNRRYAQYAGTAALLRNWNGFHRRRKVAARSHPIPKPIQVVAKLAFEHVDRFLIHSGASAVGFDALECLPDKSLGNVERLCHAPRLLPLVRLTQTRDSMTRPLRSITVTVTSSLLRAAPPLDRASVLSASRFALEPFPSHRDQRLPQVPLAARIELPLPLCRWARSQKAGSRHADPEFTSTPGFDVV